MLRKISAFALAPSALLESKSATEVSIDERTVAAACDSCDVHSSMLGFRSSATNSASAVSLSRAANMRLNVRRAIPYCLQTWSPASLREQGSDRYVASISAARLRVAAFMGFAPRSATARVCRAH